MKKLPLTLKQFSDWLKEKGNNNCGIAQNPFSCPICQATREVLNSRAVVEYSPRRGNSEFADEICELKTWQQNFAIELDKEFAIMERVPANEALKILEAVTKKKF